MLGITMIWVWLAAALLFAIGELVTTGLFFACLAFASLIAAAFSYLLPAGVQVVVFAGASLAGIAVIRPLAMVALHLSTGHEIPPPSLRSAIVNRRAIVTQAVDSHGGQIRVGQGEFWSARAFETDDVIPIGSSVEVVVVDGLTALVAPAQRPALPAEPALEKGS